MEKYFIDYAPEYKDDCGSTYLVFLSSNMHPFSRTLQALKLHPGVDKKQAREAVMWRRLGSPLDAFGKDFILELSYLKRIAFVIKLSLKWPTLLILFALFAFAYSRVGPTMEFYVVSALHLPWFLPLVLFKLLPLPKPEIKNA